MTGQIMAPAEWLEARKKTIGGTDIAAIMGLHPYKSAVDVWADKLKQGPPFEENAAMRVGKALEDFVVKEYQKATGREIQSGGGWITDKTIPFFAGTPDRFVGDEVLEIKTFGPGAANRWGKEGTTEIPDEYFLQCQWYCMLADKSRWTLAAWAKASDKLLVYEGPRNEEIIQDMREAGIDFWTSYVETGIMPPVDGSDSCARILEKLNPREQPGLIVDATPEIQGIVDRLEQVVQAWKGLYKERLQLENEIKSLMGEAEGMRVERYDKPITWKKSSDTVGPDYQVAFNLLAAAAQKAGVPGEVVLDAVIQSERVLRRGGRVFLPPWSKEKKED